MKKQAPLKETAPLSPDQFARVVGSPGEAPRLVGLFLLMWPFVLVFLMIGYLVRAAWPWPPMNSMAIGASLFFLAGALAWSIAIGRQRLDAFLKGARGEEWVARALSFLPPSFSIYHGISAGASLLLGRTGDYDHIVIGPSGIFVVETKNWSGHVVVRDGRILYDGKEPDRPPVEQVQAAVSRLRADLREHVHPDVEVQPVLCFIDGRLPGGRTGAAGVIVCSGRALIDVLMEPQETPPDKAIRDQVTYYLDQRMNES